MRLQERPGQSRFRFALATAVLLLAALPAAAQSYGGGSQDEWLPASQFAIRSGGFGWYYDNIGYWKPNFAGSLTATLEAPLHLPAGAQTSLLECYFQDADAGVDATASFFRYSYDVSSDTPSAANLGFVSTSGNSGYQRVTTPLSEQIVYSSGNTRNLYAVAIDIPATDIGFRGCRVAWNRTVSPAPGTATFSDVPTSSPQFKFVEALAAAGITAGCGGGNYCPDQPITRGQMAVFLSAALGLNWPN